MPDDSLELDDVAARALASIILERTADAINEGGKDAALNLAQLSDDTGLTLDVCAGILYVTSLMVGSAGLSAADVYAMSLAFEPDDDDLPDADDPTEVPGVTDEPDDDAALPPLDARDTMNNPTAVTVPVPDVDLDAAMQAASAALNAPDVTP